MISYNPKDWITFIFRFHKADTFRQLIPMMIFIGLYSGAIAYLEIEYWKLSQDSHVKNISIMHGMLGFVISLLLVFRTNTAYDRWWEGRKIWGSLVNNSRNLALKLSAILHEESDRAFFRKIIPSYASILNKHLKDEETSKQLFEDVVIEHHKHRPNQVAKILFHKINDLYNAKKITGDQLIIINHEIQSFTDICGACERIKNTPIPYSYSSFIKKFIFFYVMTLPFGYVFNLGYYVIPVVVFIFYVLASLELIAEEIEDPFGHDANDLPTRKIAENIKRHVEEIL
ncbi:bestrophin family protein [Flavobacterium frigidarium]|jgi:putative membrane protein|uniref:Bestrophin family ion channel n=1 Tax=Flavobacterium frigidarium TaxID=99286 RepID=A0ABV4KDT8_9FLAO|nr:bestrophin family ion channel [Flavobacterium frigidarium]|tara:strand:- start:2060 stop:2917 length:858 start_codon:yes stop_codon:yes gene_type:complete